MKKDNFIKFAIYILLFNLLFVMPFQACAPLNTISEDDEGEQNLSSSSLGKTCADTEHLEYRTPILTKAEVSYILTDLFPTEVAANANILTTVNALSEISVDRVTDKTVHPENNSGSLKSAVYLLSLIDIAQALFDQYSLGTSINTNCLNVPNSCLNYVTNNLVPRLWRRPLIDQEKAIFSNIFNGTQTLKEKLNSAFLIAFTSPQFFYKNYLPKSTGTILNYSQYSLASRISFFLYNSVPDALLWQDAQAGNLANPAVIDNHIDRLLTQEPYITRFTKHALTSWLRLDDDVDSTSTVKNAQGVSVKIADLAKQQFLQAYQVVKENRNISQIFFSDSVYMNKSIAAYLNLNSSQYSTEFQKVNIIPGTLESSFIASPFFANATNSSTNKTLVTKRGIFITKNLLCGAIPVNEPAAKLVTKTLIL